MDFFLVLFLPVFRLEYRIFFSGVINFYNFLLVFLELFVEKSSSSESLICISPKSKFNYSSCFSFLTFKGSGNIGIFVIYSQTKSYVLVSIDLL